MKRHLKQKHCLLLFAALLSGICFALPCAAIPRAPIPCAIPTLDLTVNHGSQNVVTRYNKARISLSGFTLPLPEGKAKTMSNVPETSPSTSVIPRDTDGTPLSSTPIILRGSQPMRPAEKVPLVKLQCSDSFEHMWGEPTQTGAGQAHIGADGVVLEPAPIASALLKVFVEDPKTKVRDFVFKAATDAYLKIVADYEKSLSRNPQTDEDFGPLVIIECPTLAGEQTTTPAGTTIDFDAQGIGITGERIYQQMRPAFAGDGTNTTKDAHEIFFRGYVESANESANEAPNETAVSEAPVGVDNAEMRQSDSESSSGSQPPLPPLPPSYEDGGLLAQRLSAVIGADKVKLLIDAGLTDVIRLSNAMHDSSFPKGFGAASVKKLEEFLTAELDTPTDVPANTQTPETPDAS